MKYLLTLIFLTACGSESNEIVNHEEPYIPENIGDEPQEEVGSENTTSDPTYTNSYGSNFCNSISSTLDCWGSIIFSTGHAVQKLIMGRDAICYLNNDVKCYSTTLGPITMNGNVMRGSPSSTTPTGFINLTVNTLGQICFKIATYNNSNQIHALYNVCGFAPTNNGGLN